MSDRPTPRHLGVGSAAALVIASMIGAGIFTTSGQSLADLPSRPLLLFAWALGGAIACLGAICYGALARRMPESGGEYIYLGRILHPALGFLAGWVSLLAGFTAPIAASALLLGFYLAPELDANLLATAAILIAAALHGIRMSGGIWVQNLAVAVKLLLILGFLVIGAVRVPALASTGLEGQGPITLGNFAVTLIWISFSYSGWNAAIYIAGEIRDPKLNLTRALLLGTGTVTILYLGLNAIFLYGAPLAEISGSKDIAARVALHLGGDNLQLYVRLLVALCLYTSISASIMLGPRVYARMAEDGVLPRVFASWGRNPRAGIFLQAGLALLVVWSADLGELLTYIGFTLGLSTAATVVSLMVLRAREGAAKVPVPGYPLLPLTFVGVTLATAVFMATVRPVEALLGILTIALGLPLYLLQRRQSG